MEPVTTSAMIGTLVGYLARKLQDNKSIQDFFADFTEGSVKWLRPLFLRDDHSPIEPVAQLQQNPASAARQNAVKSMLEVALEDQPGLETWLRQLYPEMKHRLAADTAHATLLNSNDNTIIQGIQSQGDTIITIGKKDDREP